MPADPSIYGAIRPYQAPADPLQQFGALMQLRAMGDASVMNDLHRRKLEGDLAEEDAFKSKIASWASAGGQGAVSPEVWAASPQRAAAFEKTRLEGEKTRGEIDKNKLEIHGKQVQQLRDSLAAANDDASLARVRDEATRLYGPSVAANMPASVSAPGFADWKKSQIMTADKLIEQMTPKFEKVDDGGKIRMVDVNPVTNPAVKGLTFNKTVTPGEAQQANQPVWDEARGVWVMRPQAAPRAASPAPAAAAAPVAATGAPGAPAAAPSGPAVVRPTGLPPRQQDVAEIRKEFNALPEVKAYRDIIPVVEAARSSPDTRAGDLQLAYAVGKVLDPNSVVREGEFKMAQDVTAPQAQLWNEVKSAAIGTGRMPPETRAQLVKMLDNAVNAREGAYKQAESTYKGIAEKNGIPVDQVIITPQTRKTPPELPKMFDAPPDPSKYKGKRLLSDDGTVYVSDGASWVRQKKAQ